MKPQAFLFASCEALLVLRASDRASIIVVRHGVIVLLLLVEFILLFHLLMVNVVNHRDKGFLHVLSV